MHGLVKMYVSADLFVDTILFDLAQKCIDK